MHLTSILFAVAATASQVDAINVRGWSSNKCGLTAYFEWRGVNPDTCLETGAKTGVHSFSIELVPANWGHIRFAKYKWGEYKCTNPYKNFVITMNGATWACSGQDLAGATSLGSAKYWFGPTKKGRDVEEPAASGNDTECVRPDVMVTEGGQEYNVTGLDVVALEKIWLGSDEQRSLDFAHLEI